MAVDVRATPRKGPVVSNLVKAIPALLDRIEALEAERDAAQATADSWRASALSWQRRETEAIAQRDAARAALTEACDLIGQLTRRECVTASTARDLARYNLAGADLRTRGGV